MRMCREIKFAHGGHLFAVANQSTINVYNFYLPDSPKVFKGHNSTIRAIAWLQDDSGFVTSSWDAYMYVWRLHSGSEENKPTWHYRVKSVNFTSLAAYKPENNKENGNKQLIYATDTMRSLREIQESDTPGGLGKELVKFEQQSCLQQVILMHNRRAIFAGIGGGTQEMNKPGSIQVIKYPFESSKPFEVQAHAQPVEHMRLSYDNSTLYSCSQDASICVFSVQDKDSKKKDKELPSVQHSQVTLIQLSQRTKIQSEIEHLQAELKQMKKNKADQAENIRQQKELQIQDLKEQIE